MFIKYILICFLSIFLGTIIVLQNDHIQTRFVTYIVTKALNEPRHKVNVGSCFGSFPFDFSCRQVKVYDAKGQWFDLKEFALKMSLFKGSITLSEPLFSRFPIFENTIEISWPSVLKTFLTQTFLQKIMIHKANILEHKGGLELDCVGEQKKLCVSFNQDNLELTIDQKGNINSSLKVSPQGGISHYLNQIGINKGFLEARLQTQISLNTLNLTAANLYLVHSEYGKAEVKGTQVQKNSWNLNMHLPWIEALQTKISWDQKSLKAKFLHRLGTIDAVVLAQSLVAKGQIFNHAITSQAQYNNPDHWSMSLDLKGDWAGRLSLKQVKGKLDGTGSLYTHKFAFSFLKGREVHLDWSHSAKQMTFKSQWIDLGGIRFPKTDGILTYKNVPEISFTSHQKKAAQLDIKGHLKEKTFIVKNLNCTTKTFKTKLLTPWTIHAGGASPLNLAINSGQLTTTSLTKTSGAIGLKNFPLCFFEMLSPLGRVQGTCDGTGVFTKNEITGHITINNLLPYSLESIKHASESPINGQVDFVWKKGLTGKVSLTSGHNRILSIQLSPTIIALNGDIALNPVSFLIPLSDRIAGLCSFQNVRVQGSSKPNISGLIKVTGIYELGDLGTTLKNIDIVGEGKGNHIQITRLKATDNKKGIISGQGALHFPSYSQINPNLSLLIENFVFVHDDSLLMKGGGNLTCKGKGTKSTITGHIQMTSGKILLDEIAPKNIPTLKIEKPYKKQSKKDLYPFFFPLDIQVVIDKLMVNGLGLESLWKGPMNIVGSILEPKLKGRLSLSKNGRLEIFCKPMFVKRGSVQYSLDKVNEPLLLIEAEKIVSDLTIFLKIEGYSSSPKFTFSSNPAYPEEDVLSWLLFGKGIGKLSAGQGLQLASSLSPFKGTKQLDIFSHLRSALGIDVEVAERESSTGTTEQAIRIEKDIDQRIRVLVEGSSESKASVKVTLTPSLSVSADVGGGHTSGVGIDLERRYD